MNLSQLTDLLFSNLGCNTIYAKELSANDNSKNQVYLGGDYTTIQMLPFGEIDTDDSDSAGSKRPRFKVKLDFSWIDDKGNDYPAPGAQLILYPDYPEVRFSGFLRGSGWAPSELMSGRNPGRILFLGVNNKEGKIYGYVCASNSLLRNELVERKDIERNGLYYEIRPITKDSKDVLLEALLHISEKGWIDSKRLNSKGEVVPCNAPQCGGYTLEAELGIIPNSRSEPDYEGWELKQFATGKSGVSGNEVITLITPEPDGGIYKDNGFLNFMSHYGYPDKSGKPDRINFGGVHYVGESPKISNLKLVLEGYENGQITNVNGYLGLIDKNDNLAASWSYASFLAHWNRKHAKTAYVPSEKRNDPELQYRYYYDTIMLGVGSRFNMLLECFKNKFAYYDPGLKIENFSSKPISKKRNQFRIKVKHLNHLYETFEVIK